MNDVNSIPHRVHEYLHKFVQSLHDHTSTASAAIGGASGGVASWIVKFQPTVTEITLHLASVVLYSAVGAATGVVVKFVAERLINRFAKSNQKSKSK